MYFTQVHEDAILKYAASNCSKEKTKLYVSLIQPAFNEMVDKIVFTYKFTTLPNIDELREECKIWLTTILGKYDVTKKSKAFSYFSVITKNWFIHKVKQRAKRAQREVDYDEALKEQDFDDIVCYNPYEEETENKELKSILDKAIQNLSPDYRVVFLLRDVEGLSTEETAQITDLSIPAVKSRLHRARAFLRKEINEAFSK